MRNFYKLKKKRSQKNTLGTHLAFSQRASFYIKKIIEELRMERENTIKTPTPLKIMQQLASDSPIFEINVLKKAIGILTYPALRTRPDIEFSVNVLSRQVSEPTLT
ncbi:hypothetical protein O181_075878 [Austropuccinia psidii MF-1]|uniref:Uncharacterized protein n=1 Tax=Austropuccinia psidii MF-1 TaxID=1389203 RepID=A0A9Q3F9R4_9BASI|nr:hypothetical protein [Austropuccinia psidii MF-1]